MPFVLVLLEALLYHSFKIKLHVRPLGEEYGMNVRLTNEGRAEDKFCHLMSGMHTVLESICITNKIW